VFVIDGYAGWDPKYKKKARVICTRPYHAMFMK
jgi:phosphoenolpyruvate carboxykinase (ATP)